MKNLLFVISTFWVLNVNAQSYLITFAGTGASTTVNSVEVENLTAGTSLTLNGDDILSLTSTVGIAEIGDDIPSRMRIYPNPMKDNSMLLISAPEAGDATISVYDITGKVLAQINCYIESYELEFVLSGLSKGFYVINVKGDTYQFSGNLISNAQSSRTISIQRIGEHLTVEKKTLKLDSKGLSATVEMQYTAGDMLKFTGKSGVYSTVLTDIPTQDKLISFEFISCTDGDNNDYPVVKIGTQTWMAENLKTTKYNDGADIPLVVDNTEWSNLITPGYCWYDNEEATYKDTYGAIYNWYAVNAGKLCPTGWRAPTDAEFTTLITYLGGETPAGRKLKETGTTHWYSPNFATNETGFTALPGGFRSGAFGAFDAIKNGGEFWSATDDGSATDAYSYSLWYDAWNFWRGYGPKKSGISVRCLRD